MIFTEPIQYESYKGGPNGSNPGYQSGSRGGSFIRSAHQSRSAHRWKYEASYRGSEVGVPLCSWTSAAIEPQRSLKPSIQNRKNDRIGRV